ncbi:hypothetical protein IIA28_14430 [candidate division KSB1 bacterium]|nr:hypothetical protein [candidate division KSB1 bacterium]MCH8019964.1 hypothetical protein [candidate division KSB1 bacterium]MCH8956495.1 hypothetical protein [candidate division KSB1 bacterium]
MLTKTVKSIFPFVPAKDFETQSRNDERRCPNNAHRLQEFTVDGSTDD